MALLMVEKSRIEKLIKKYKKEHKGYAKLIQEKEAEGLETLNSEDTEYYGVYLGKAEILQEIIADLEKVVA